jgi:hypothetical protein
MIFPENHALLPKVYAEFDRDLPIERRERMGISAGADAQPVRGARQSGGIFAMELCA